MTTTGRAIAFRVLAVLGIVLAAYALYVEHKVSTRKARLSAGLADDEHFVALCDMSWGSCSDVLTSEHSRLFGPPNAFMGLLFYIAIFIYPSVNFVPFKEYLLLGVTAFSCALTIYLGSVLYRMGDFCILCVSTYVINWILLYVTVGEVKTAGKVNNKKKL